MHLMTETPNSGSKNWPNSSEIHNSTRELRLSLSIIARTRSRGQQKNTTNQVYLKDIYRMLHSITAAGCTFFQVHMKHSLDIT